MGGSGGGRKGGENGGGRNGGGKMKWLKCAGGNEGMKPKMTLRDGPANWSVSASTCRLGRKISFWLEGKFHSHGTAWD